MVTSYRLDMQWELWWWITALLWNNELKVDAFIGIEIIYSMVRLNIKMSSFPSKKCKTISRPSYLYNGKFLYQQNGLYIENRPQCVLALAHAGCYSDFRGLQTKKTVWVYVYPIDLGLLFSAIGIAWARVLSVNTVTSICLISAAYHWNDARGMYL